MPVLRNADEVTVCVHSTADWPQVQHRWEQVAAASPDASFFLTADWVDTWLSVVGPALKNEILTFDHQGKTVACCLLVWRRNRRGPFPIDCVFFMPEGCYRSITVGVLLRLFMIH